MNPSSLPVLLRSLCLGEMARVLEALTEQAGRDGWSHEQYLRALCDVEVGRRAERRRERLLKESRMPDGKTLATLECGFRSKVTTHFGNKLPVNSE